MIGKVPAEILEAGVQGQRFFFKCDESLEQVPGFRLRGSQRNGIRQVQQNFHEKNIASTIGPNEN